MVDVPGGTKDKHDELLPALFVYVSQSSKSFKHNIIFFRKHRARVEEEDVLTDTPDYRHFPEAQLPADYLSRCLSATFAIANSHQSRRQTSAGQATAAHHRLPRHHPTHVPESLRP